MSASEQRPDQELDRLVDGADLDGLVRLVDARCDDGDWDGLLRLREAARMGVRTGRQLWPAATLAEYRTALLAPAQWAAQVIGEDTSRFAIGPLTEVVAQGHTWAELSPLLANGPATGFVAHERVIRGEAFSLDSGIQPVLDLPLQLQPWEPAYALAVYERDAARFDPPPLPGGLREVELRAASPNSVVEDADAGIAIRGLVEPWTAASNGSVTWAAVNGDHLDAISALGVRQARVAALEPRDALAWLAWAGASGGAHGRRRGAATGRFEAWWTLAALGGALDDWPIPPGELGEIAESLDWYWWDAFEPVLGWQIRLAIEDPDEGLAWAFAAQDTSG